MSTSDFNSNSAVVESIEAFDIPSSNSNEDLSNVILEIINSGLVFTDILIHEGQTIKVRQSKNLKPVTSWTVDRNQLINFFHTLDSDWEINIKVKAIDRPFDLSNYRIRSNCFTYMGGKKLGAVIRKFPLTPRSFDEIGLDLNSRSLADIENGLVLVVGDTCQGKSTTLASLLNHINQTRSGHLITIEEPIEGLIPDIKCAVTQREVGKCSDVTTYVDGARDALRERPDAVMIGEIRDSETAIESLALAESGPIIFCSLHARTPEQAISKFCRLLGDEKHHRKAFASVLRGIICQALVPTIDGDGSVLATEVLKVTPTIIEYIENDRPPAIRSHINTLSTSATGSGTHSMNSSLKKLINDGKISLDDAKRASTDRASF